MYAGQSILGKIPQRNYMITTILNMYSKANDRSRQHGEHLSKAWLQRLCWLWGIERLCAQTLFAKYAATNRGAALNLHNEVGWAKPKDYNKDPFSKKSREALMLARHARLLPCHWTWNELSPMFPRMPTNNWYAHNFNRAFTGCCHSDYTRLNNS